MYLVVLKNKETEEIINCARTVSGEPRRIPYYNIAEREAHELNIKERSEYGPEFEWEVQDIKNIISGVRL